MGRVPDIKRIQKEDFEEDDQEMIEKLAYPINSFMEQTRSLFDKNIDNTNLNQEIIVLVVTVNASGIPTTQTRYKSSLKTKVAGVSCINYTNVSSPGVYPTGGISIGTTQSGTLITINHITGLQANNKYQLTLLSYGT